jgi:para-aminobenzoate synthetase component 1
MIARSCVVPLAEALATDELLSRLRARRGLVALDSAAGSPRDWSLVAFDPLVEVPTPQSIAQIRGALAALEVRGGDPIPGPYHGGFVGALAYDIGVAGERGLSLPDDPWHTPRIAGGVYVDFVVRDERAGRAWLVLHEIAGLERPSLVERRAEIEALLAQPCARTSVPRPLGPLVRETSPAEHMRRIEELRERIADGDLYQANLAHRFERRIAGHPVDLYARLRRVNPAPYMAYLAWEAGLAAPATDFPRGALLSASPELFFEFDGVTARTRPIKGTAARSPDPRVDHENARALVTSTKDRAELAMIVDLERNDLGRVARIGSVRTEAFPRLESYAAVHHLTADVTAEIAEGRDAIDILEALFPGGSITGAPKVAAMRQIARLEGAGRGFFTGALGFVDVRGHAAWNILIRTLVWRPCGGGDGEVSFHVGGGITWSSNAAAEERETLFKAEKLLETLAGEL